MIGFEIVLIRLKLNKDKINNEILPQRKGTNKLQ